jgi:thiamine pyrophosphate-dependent acetolactate synthase large subunit-like protein
MINSKQEKGASTALDALAPSKEITGSQAVLEALIAEGTDTIFGIPGGAILPIYDTLYDYSEQLTHILVRQWQELFSDSRYSFVEIESPDFVALAGSYKISGRRVSEREDLHQALTEMLSEDRAFLLEVMVIKEDNVFPMIPQGASISEIRLT